MTSYASVVNTPLEAANYRWAMLGENGRIDAMPMHYLSPRTKAEQGSVGPAVLNVGAGEVVFSEEPGVYGGESVISP